MPELTQKQIDLLIHMAQLLTGRLASPDAKAKMNALLDQIEEDRKVTTAAAEETEIQHAQKPETASVHPTGHHRR